MLQAWSSWQPLGKKKHSNICGCALRIMLSQSRPGMAWVRGTGIWPSATGPACGGHSGGASVVATAQLASGSDKMHCHCDHEGCAQHGTRWHAITDGHDGWQPVIHWYPQDRVMPVLLDDSQHQKTSPATGPLVRNQA